ncbi:MAG: hypothetical protein Q9222_007061, partial [Ikaeria aurantiellina]
MSPGPSSPLFHTAKTSQSAKARRKFSLSFFRHQNLDSSEDIPSPHSSLWDAPLAEAPLNTAIPIGTWDATCADITPTPERPKSRKRGKRKGKAKPVSPPAKMEASISSPFDPSVHHPHLLDTITERSSRPTLRSHQPSIQSFQHGRPSISTLRARTSALRKESFSLADLPTPSPPSSSHSSNKSSPSSSKLNLPIEPTHDPPQRLPTPPGLPTFNTPEAINYRLPSPHLSFRERLRRQPSQAAIQYRRQTARLPPGVVMRGEAGELIRGRWKQGGHSGHTGYGTQGALDSHPFTRAPMAQIASEEHDDAAAPPTGSRSSHADRGMGIGPAEASGGGMGRKGTRWERFVEASCFVCFGVERGADGRVVEVGP